jgi:hypothetical protein
MDGLPARGPAVRRLGIPLPPGRMPAWRGTRPLKRWRYVGVYAPELMLCVADARIGPVPQRWWAVTFPDGTLRERSTVGRGGVSFDGARVRVDAKGVRIDLELSEGDAVEVVSPAGESYIWTAKQAAVPVRGHVTVDGERHELDTDAAFIDDSAGYHPRHTAWKWSAGVGRLDDGRRVGWNLVTGVHDSPERSERTVWVEGEPHEVAAQEFADDLSSVGGLRFTEWSAREEDVNLILMRSRYRQPFGTFAGELPGGLRLADGYGVMEEHDVRW